MEAKFFKEFKYKYRHRKYKSATIVLGDESCDLDSAVSAIGYAALMEYESRFQRNRFPGYRDPNPDIPRDIFLPMLDVRRDDIHMKTEFLHLWAKYKFDVADLLMKDDLPSLKKQVQRDPTTKIVLVNHHILSDDYKYLAPYVTTIVDHRPMQPNAKSLYGRNVKWIMKDTASCASIVIDEIKYFDDRVDNYPLFFRWYPALLNILRATVVYDTLNFNSALRRFTDLDLKMAEYLEEYIETENPQDHPSTWSRATKLKGMLEARADVSKCIAFDVLRKDAKRVENIYFAHVPILLKDYMKKVDHLDAMPEVLEAYGCETLAMLCSYYPPVKICEGLRKEFAVFSPDREFAEELIEYFHSWTRPSFILTPKLDNEVEKLYAFDVHNMAATKEHFVVALNSFFESKREIALEIERNQEKSTVMKENVRAEHNGTAMRKRTEKKQETAEIPTTVRRPEKAGKKTEVTVMEIEPVQIFGPIVEVELDWEKHKLLGSEIVVELAETMKKGLIFGIPNLLEEQRIKEKQGTMAEIEMTEVAADGSYVLEESMTDVQEQETAENAIEKLKTVTEPLMVEEPKAVKEQEPKIEKDQKITEFLKTVIEPQMVDVSKTVEKQIIGEEQKTVDVQKTVTEPQDVEESTTVQEKEQTIGEEKEKVEVSKTVVETQTPKQYLQKFFGKEVTAEDIRMVQVLLMLRADESQVLEETTTIGHKKEKEQETVEKTIEKLKTATEPQMVEESKAVKDQEPKIEKDQKITKVLKTVIESQMVDVSKTVEKQIIGEEQKTVDVQKTVTEPQDVEESTTVQEKEQTIGEEKEKVEVSKTVVETQTPKQYLQEFFGKEVTAEDMRMVQVLLMLRADESQVLEETTTIDVQEHKKEKEQETAEKAIEKLKTATEPQTVEESKAVKDQEPKIEKDQKITKVLKTVIESQMVDVSKTVEKQIIEEQKTVDVQKTVTEPQDVEESTTVQEKEQAIGEEKEKVEVSKTVVETQTPKQYLQEFFGKEVTAEDMRMVQVLLMLRADESQVLEETTTIDVQEHKKEKEQETAEKAIEKLKTATEPQTVEESKAVKDQEPKIEKDQKITKVLKTVIESQMVDVSKTVEKQIIEEQKTVDVQKTVTEPQDVEESTTVQEKEQTIGEEKEKVEVSKTVVETQTPKQYLQEFFGKEVTAEDMRMVQVLLMLRADQSQVLEETTTIDVQEHKKEKEQETAEKAIEKLKTATEPQMVEESKAVKDQEPKIEIDQKITKVLKTVIESQMVDVSKTVEKQIIEEQKTVDVQKTVTEPQDVEESTTVQEKEQTIGEEKEKVEVSKTVVETQTPKQYLQEFFGKEVTAEDMRMVQVLLMLRADESQVLEETTTIDVQEHKKEKEQETAEKAIEKLKTATEPQTVEESKAVKYQEPKTETDQKMTKALKKIVEQQMVDVSKTVEKQIRGEEQKTMEVQKTVAEPHVVEESTTAKEQEQEIEEVSKTVVESQMVKQKQYFQKVLGKEVSAADTKMVQVLLMLAADKSHVLEESTTVEVQEQKIEAEQKTAENKMEELKTATEPQLVKRGKEQKIRQEQETVKMLVAETRSAEQQKIREEQVLERKQMTKKLPTSAEPQELKARLDENYIMEREQRVADKVEITAVLEPTTKPLILQELNVVKKLEEKRKMVEKQGVVDNIEIMEVLKTAAETKTLEEQKMEKKQAIKKEQRMEEKQKMTKEQKVDEDRTKDDIDIDEILRLVSELDISGEKDKRERKLPKERIVAVAKEADIVFTRCSRTEKTIAAMRQEAEKEKKLAEQKEMEIEREITMALKEEESDRENDKIREAEIARQKEMEIEKEITMVLKEEEEEIEKRKAREKELEEQEKASRPAELTEHDNSQDAKVDSEELGSSGF